MRIEGFKLPPKTIISIPHQKGGDMMHKGKYGAISIQALLLVTALLLSTTAGEAIVIVVRDAIAIIVNAISYIGLVTSAITYAFCMGYDMDIPAWITPTITLSIATMCVVGLLK